MVNLKLYLNLVGLYKKGNKSKMNFVYHGFTKHSSINDNTLGSDPYHVNQWSQSSLSN